MLPVGPLAPTPPVAPPPPIPVEPLAPAFVGVPPMLLPPLMPIFARPRRRRIRVKAPRRYVPSLIAIVEKIQRVGVPPAPRKIFTGLEVRPIFVPKVPKKRRKKRKRKKKKR